MVFNCLVSPGKSWAGSPLTPLVRLRGRWGCLRWYQSQVRVVSARSELGTKWCCGLDHVNEYKGLSVLLSISCESLCIIGFKTLFWYLETIDTYVG